MALTVFWIYRDGCRNTFSIIWVGLSGSFVLQCYAWGIPDVNSFRIEHMQYAAALYELLIIIYIHPIEKYAKICYSILRIIDFGRLQLKAVLDHITPLSLKSKKPSMKGLFELRSLRDPDGAISSWLFTSHLFGLAA